MIYSTLIDRVAEYLDRSDLGTSSSSPLSSTKIGSWINDARTDIALKWPFKYLYVEATCSTIANTANYALPSDYLGHLELWVGSKKLVRLTGREADMLTETDVDATYNTRALTLEAGSSVSIDTSEGSPDYYIDRGMEFELWPIPDAVYTLKIKYYAQPTNFVISTDYDYISTFHFEAVIWGTALRGAMFLDDNDKKQTFKASYEEAIKEMVRREKQFAMEDQFFRVRDYRDFDLTTFKKLMKVRI